MILIIIMFTQTHSYLHAMNKHVHLEIYSVAAHNVLLSIENMLIVCIHITVAEQVSCQIHTKILSFCITHNFPK